MSRSNQQVSVGDLQFALYSRPAHPELFRIEHSQEVQEREYSASVWLIEGGHVVTFCWKKNYIVEILAGARELRPRGGVLQEFALRGEKTCRQCSEEGLKYVMAGNIERMSEKVFASIYQDTLATAQSRGILVLRGTSETATAPFAYAEIEARDSELHITTCHAFPDDLAMAKTQSIFKAPAGSRRLGNAANKSQQKQSPDK